MPASSSMTRMLAVGGLPLACGAEAEMFKGSSTSGMYRSPHQGKLKVEGSAGAYGAFHADFAGMLLDDSIGDGKAQTRAAPVARPGGGLGGEERIVDPLQVLRGNAAARIRHRSFHTPVSQGGHAQPPTGGHCILGVQKQVYKYLLK